jgi:hypothetical protein
VKTPVEAVVVPIAMPLIPVEVNVPILDPAIQTAIAVDVVRWIP